MRVEFNALNKARKQTLTLCNPNGEELDFLGMARDIEYSKKYNETSSLSFTIPKYKDGDLVEYYDRLVTNRVVKLEHEGTYLINKIDREIGTDGAEYKHISCVGLEYEFADKTINELIGTYCLYDATGGSKDKDLMHFILTHYMPTWSLSEVDSDLWNTFRTFELKDKNVFNLLMGEVAKSFDCVFLFDTFNKTIKIVKTKNIHKQTDIYISSKNLLKSLNIEEDSNSLITALTVFGGGDLTIRGVNPLGGALYNFDYFIKNDFLSPDLAQAIEAWKKKCESGQEEFVKLLDQLKTKQNELVVLQTEKTVLDTQKKVLEQHHAIAITAGDNASCTKYKNEIQAKENEIKAKQVLVDAKAKEVTATQTAVTNLTNSLSLDSDTNFTPEQRLELNPYIKQGSVTNGDFLITDRMSVEEVSQVGTELMEWGQEQLAKCSQPIWDFSVDVISFTNLIEYKDFTTQLDMGSEVVIEVDKDKDLYAYTVLVGYEVDVDNNQTVLLFSNQLNYQSKTLTFDELFDTSASISKDYMFDTTKRQENDKTTTKMDEYIEQGFIDITKEVLATTNQEFEIGDNGIRGREWIPETQAYSNEEVRMTKNVLAFSDDNFATTRTAIGKTLLPDGTKAYGVIAENLVGKQILGKTLLLETSNKSLVWDGENLTIKNANIIMGDDRFLEDTLLGIEGVANQANSTANTANSTANSANNKVNGIVDGNGNISTSKLVGTITAGKTNIVLGSGSKFMRLNENGILITNNGGASYQTAIGVDGIVADMIKAGGTLSGCHLTGGSAVFGQADRRRIEISDIGYFITYYGEYKGVALGATDKYSTISLSNPTKHATSPMTFYVDDTSDCSMQCLAPLLISSRGYSRWENNGTGILIDGGDHLYLDGSSVDVTGSFRVTGSKNAIIPTQHYGVRELYCEECDKAYFTTKGVGETVDNICEIILDDVFIETIELNNNYPYTIQLTSYSDARIWIEEVGDYSFIVRSDKETKFTYTLSALRITFGDMYLEEVEIDKKRLDKIQQLAVDRLNQKYQ